MGGRAGPIVALIVTLAACGSPDMSGAPPAATPRDTAFPKPYLEAGDWRNTDFGVLPGPDRLPSLDAARAAVRSYFLAGIRTAAPDNGVTIVQTGTDPQSQRVSLLVTAIGGANAAVAGWQMRVLLHRDQRGWWMDPSGSARVYCLKPLGGVAGTTCVG